MTSVPGARHGMLSSVRGIWLGLDVLTVVLVVVAVAQVGADGGAADEAWLPWTASVLGVAFLAVYAWGRWAVRLPGGAWILALTVLWALMLVNPWALWVAFPLMLLQMHVLGPHRGVLAVAATVVLAVGARYVVLGHVHVGDVVGPVIGGAVAVGVVLGLEALVRESQERQRLLDELADAERERAVAEERERLARDIHDTLAQGFSAIELQLRSAAGPGVEQARATARENLAEARRFVRELSPPDLEGATLVLALQRVAARVPGRGGPEVDVVVTGEPQTLPVPVETALLRVAQSALANVVQHAGASRAAVTLSYLGDAVALDVVDDGVGGALDEGFGIAAMRSRVRQLGGRLALESEPGSGTALAVTLPVAGDGVACEERGGSS
ncbi:sensor histidine kinase [Cellulomonas sp. PhB143]|uniref:sensor histidine kinase n=1 Tax=Cellulomonas sp. PhB143 TaxID=2485186 RepID=UPI000FB1A530|nr:sensor histidine kinase [Cellulomonas sp. PhB143]ROS75325.1 signal transduction histidine kinase [Cellulomonas sp. PhB143]